MKNLKHFWLACAALAATLVCTPGAALADPGDFADYKSRYGWDGLTGNANYPQAVIGMKVASADFGTLETMIHDETGITCTRSTGCLKIVSRADNQTGYPTTTDQGELEKVAEAISGLLLNGSGAPILFVDCVQADATNLNAAWGTAIAAEFNGTGNPGAGVVTQTYTIAAASQATLTTFLANHTGDVAVVPNGFLASSLAVQVGGTQDSGGMDVCWTCCSGGDIAALEHSIPFPWGTKDSPYFAAGAIASRLNQQAGAPATRSVLLNADPSHFVANGCSTLGIFKDGNPL